MKKNKKLDLQNEELVQPFDPKKIDIITKQMILNAIIIRLKNEEIDLKTYFQRASDLWDAKKQSRLIESILIRLPLPAFYFDGSDDSNWLVVDGLQRLSTINNFVIKKNLKLTNLEYLVQFNGSRYDELPRDLQRRIEEHEVTVYIINSGTPHEVKFNLFRRINTGGLILNAQEIRNAINQGGPAEFVAKLAELPEFLKFGISTKRMVDRDYVARFLAFYLNGHTDYKSDLDAFLNDSMASLKNKKKSDLLKIEEDFKISLRACMKIFKNRAFRKSQTGKRGPLNKALFEIFSVTLSRLTPPQIDFLVKKEKRIQTELALLLKKDKDFERSISTSTDNRKKVIKRFDEVQKIISRVLNDK